MKIECCLCFEDFEVDERKVDVCIECERIEKIICYEKQIEEKNGGK